MSLEKIQKWLQFKYMNFLEIINNKKMTLITVVLLIYVMLNLIDGKRGLISYFEKKIIINDLFEKKKVLNKKLNLVEKKNNLLTPKLTPIAGIYFFPFFKLLYIILSYLPPAITDLLSFIITSYITPV